MKHGIIVVLVMAVILGVGSVRAVGIEIVWNRTDCGRCSNVVSSGDGGYIVAGKINSYIASADSYIAKVDSEGNKIWEDTYGRRNFNQRMICEGVSDLVQSGDGGFPALSIAKCPISSADYGASCEACVFKVDSLGNKVWEKIYKNVDAFCIMQAGDGGFILGGSLDETLYVFKIDSQGEKIWDKKPNLDTPLFSPSQRSSFYAITESGDGGYVLAGAYNDFRNVCVLKIDSQGNKVWEYTSGEGEKHPWAVTRNGEGFITMGTSGDESLYLLGLDKDGNKTWEKMYPDTWGYDIIPSGDGFLITGEQGRDSYLLKIDSSGNRLWWATIPDSRRGYKHGLYGNEATAITEAGDEEYIIVSRDGYIAKIRIGPNIPVSEFSRSSLIFTGIIFISISLAARGQPPIRNSVPASYDFGIKRMLTRGFMV